MKPQPNTKVRILVDNRPYIKTSLVWQPPEHIVEGSVAYSEPTDDKNTIRINCPNYPLTHRVIPIENIIKMENLDTGEVYMGNGEEAVIDAPKELFFMIESSRANQWYKVRKVGDKWQCECIAGLHGKKCKHAAEAEKRALEFTAPA